MFDLITINQNWLVIKLLKPSMDVIGEQWQKMTQSSTRSQFLQDKINFENLTYISFTESSFKILFNLA